MSAKSQPIPVRHRQLRAESDGNISQKPPVAENWLDMPVLHPKPSVAGICFMATAFLRPLPIRTRPAIRLGGALLYAWLFHFLLATREVFDYRLGRTVRASRSGNRTALMQHFRTFF